MNIQVQKHCVVVTYFSEGQPGFLDFSYRIKSLAGHYRLTVVSNFPLVQEELRVENANYIVIGEGERYSDWLRYLWRCAGLIRRLKPNLALLLDSTAAPISMLVGGIPTGTYWNEHPTHVAPDPEGFMPVKAVLRRMLRWMMFEGARQSSLVMPIGEAHRDDLLAHGCDPQRMRMIYMGVERYFTGVALTGSEREHNAPLRLIYIGSVRKDRGRDVMLEAMAAVNRNRRIAHLTIVGADEEQFNYCSQRIRTLGIEDSVTLHGRVPGYTIPDYLQQADAGLCLWEDTPWYRFNPPTKLFEYLVAGLPVLASDIPTHTQYVRSGFNGLVFEYGSEGLVAAINQLWRLREQLPEMKQRTNAASDAYQWHAIEPLFLAASNGVAR